MFMEACLCMHYQHAYLRCVFVSVCPVCMFMCIFIYLWVCSVYSMLTTFIPLTVSLSPQDRLHPLHRTLRPCPVTPPNLLLLCQHHPQGGECESWSVPHTRLCPHLPGHLFSRDLWCTFRFL
ncbi:hypothetical protein EON63_14795 [archaeon]|nr:MAG: hypothetical protein EON63_14795 [archaeon]